VKVLFLTFSNEQVASSRTRVYQYLPFLVRRGVSCQVVTQQSGYIYELVARFSIAPAWCRLCLAALLGVLKKFDRALSLARYVRFLLACNRNDIVFIQKALIPIWLQRLVGKINTNIVFDFDDAIYLTASTEQRKRFDHQIKMSKLAVVENRETARCAEKAGIPSIQITGPIDCGRYRPRGGREARDELIIGWIGSEVTTDYLRILAKALAEISDRFRNVVLELVGAGPVEFSGVRMRRFRWALEDEVQMLERFDIGIMPLPDNEFARGKGGYKILQYMAMGIPSVASPVGINAEIILPGKTGFLASTSEEWCEALKLLIQDEALRHSLGAQARWVALQQYSLDLCSGRLYEALMSIHRKPQSGGSEELHVTEEKSRDRQEPERMAPARGRLKIFQPPI
jgi:glycosyltransferase involved in cell wall biosynthesis